MKKIVIIGVGALGSHLVLLIRNLSASITVVDFDRIESKNTMSQFHTKQSVGKNKAHALQQMLNGFFGVRVEAVPHRLTADNLQQILGGADLIVDCVDNGETRVLIQSFATANNIPCLHGAVDANGSFGRVCWTESFKIDFEGAVGTPTCEDGRHLPFLSRVSAYLADSVQRFVEQGQKVGYQVSPSGSFSI